MTFPAVIPASNHLGAHLRGRPGGNGRVEVSPVGQIAHHGVPEGRRLVHAGVHVGRDIQALQAHVERLEEAGPRSAGSEDVMQAAAVRQDHPAAANGA